MFPVLEVISRLTKFSKLYTAIVFSFPYNFTFFPFNVTKSPLSLSLAPSSVSRPLRSLWASMASPCVIFHGRKRMQKFSLSPAFIVLSLRAVTVKHEVFLQRWGASQNMEKCIFTNSDEL
jgi:hypothetical protein